MCPRKNSQRRKHMKLLIYQAGRRICYSKQILAALAHFATRSLDNVLVCLPCGLGDQSVLTDRHSDARFPQHDQIMIYCGSLRGSRSCRGGGSVSVARAIAAGINWGSVTLRCQKWAIALNIHTLLLAYWHHEVFASMLSQTTPI